MASKRNIVHKLRLKKAGGHKSKSKKHHKYKYHIRTTTKRRYNRRKR